MHNYSLRVFFEHTDAGGVVYHANYLNFCEQARTEWLRSFGISQQNLKDKFNLGFVVIHADCKWQLPAMLDDLLTVQSQIEKITPVRIIFHQQIFKENKENKENDSEKILLFTTKIEIACVEFQTENKNKNKNVIAKKIPPELVEKFKNNI